MINLIIMFLNFLRIAKRLAGGNQIIHAVIVIVIRHYDVVAVLCCCHRQRETQTLLNIHIISNDCLPMILIAEFLFYTPFLFIHSFIFPIDRSSIHSFINPAISSACMYIAIIMSQH